MPRLGACKPILLLSGGVPGTRISLCLCPGPRGSPFLKSGPCTLLRRLRDPLQVQAGRIVDNVLTEEVGLVPENYLALVEPHEGVVDWSTYDGEPEDAGVTTSLPGGPIAPADAAAEASAAVAA